MDSTTQATTTALLVLLTARNAATLLESALNACQPTLLGATDAHVIPTPQFSGTIQQQICARTLSLVLPADITMVKIIA
jgi:hypothetical protein